MNLREYLFENKISVKDFAKKINFCAPYISRHLSGSRKYNGKLAIAIENATGGLIKTAEILGKTDPELSSTDYTRQNNLFYETLAEFIEPELLEKIVSTYTKKIQAGGLT